MTDAFRLHVSRSALDAATALGSSSPPFVLRLTSPHGERFERHHNLSLSCPSCGTLVAWTGYSPHPADGVRAWIAGDDASTVATDLRQS